MSLRDCFASHKVKNSPYYVPILKETVYIRQWSGAERLKYGLVWKDCHDEPDKVVELTAKMLIADLFDKDGKQVFKDDLQGVMDLDADLFTELVNAVYRANGIDVEPFRPSERPFSER